MKFERGNLFMENSSFIDKFTIFASKIGAQVHLRSLRDAFTVTMPFFILAGIAVLVNYVILERILTGDALATAQVWGNMITNGTLNIAGLLIAPCIAYMFAKNKNFDNPISAVAIAISVLVIMMPLVITIAPVGSETAVEVGGVLGFDALGTKGMFTGIISGLLATEVYIRLCSIKQLQINLGKDVPEMVGKSFSAMIPIMLTLSIFALLSFLLHTMFSTNVLDLISTMIQEPLRKMNTSLIGTLTIYSTGNLLFGFGIHQAVINGTLLDPLLLANTNDNMLAYAAGQPIPHIINHGLVNIFGMIGGTGSTICLLIATFIFGKFQMTKDIAKLSVAPGLFNINEPVIFGYPIVFNLPMIIPFVLVPAMGITVAYFATAMGMMNHAVVLIPWTTPPLLSAYLATAGDWRAVIVQLVIIILGVMMYLPFMKINERVAMNLATEEEAE